MIGHHARAPDIQISSEMVEAGLSTIKGFELIDAWEGSLSRAELVKAIYLAMEEKNSRHLSGPALLEKCHE
jgi:hypothetical protein